MDCIFCEQFIWKRGSELHGKAVCADCLRALNGMQAVIAGLSLDAIKQQLREQADELDDELRSAVSDAQSAIRDAVDDALSNFERIRAKVPA